MNPYVVGILGIVFFYCFFGMFAIERFIYSIQVGIRTEEIKNENKLAAERNELNGLNTKVRTYKQYTPPTLTPRERAKLKRKTTNSVSTNKKTTTTAQKRPAKTTKKPVVATKKPSNRNNPVIKDAIGGLVSLGISRSDAKTLVEKTYNPAITNAEELFSKCLQKVNS